MQEVRFSRRVLCNDLFGPRTPFRDAPEIRDTQGGNRPHRANALLALCFLRWKFYVAMSEDLAVFPWEYTQSCGSGG